MDQIGKDVVEALTEKEEIDPLKGIETEHSAGQRSHNRNLEVEEPSKVEEFL